MGVGELRYVWITFQIVWPCLWVLFEGYPYEGFILWIIIPSVIVFWIISLLDIRGQNFYQDGFHGMKDISPTMFWCLIALSSSNGDAELEITLWIFVFGLAIGLVLGALFWVLKCCQHGPSQGTNVFVTFCWYKTFSVFGRQCMNPFQTLEDLEWDRQQEQLEREQERLGAQIKKLSYLEDLSRQRGMKVPGWIPKALLVVAISSFGLLVRLHFLLAPYEWTGNIGNRYDDQGRTNTNE